MVDYGHGIVGYVLNLICLLSGLIVFVISLMVFAIIIYHQYQNRLKREEKITLILSVNILLYSNPRLICIACRSIFSFLFVLVQR